MKEKEILRNWPRLKKTEKPKQLTAMCEPRLAPCLEQGR